MSLTPCVALPASLISWIPVLMVTPDLQVMMRSSFSVTYKIPTRLPVLSVTLMVFTPLPPLLVIRYSSIGVRFPYPFSLTTNIVRVASSLFTQIIPTTSSFSSSTSIPVTPMAPRPVARTFTSSKRIARPDFKANIISEAPSVMRASSNSSPSLMVIAFTPLALGLLKSSRDVFLMIPFLVQSMM